MAHGGTNFGFYNGANTGAGESDYKPDLTSYDYVRKRLMCFVITALEIHVTCKGYFVHHMHQTDNCFPGCTH